MTAKELIAVLSGLPPDTIIHLPAEGDDIMGDYRYNSVIGIEEKEAALYTSKKGGTTLYTTYSNYASLTDKDIKIYVLY
jgi:hypothetical protein